MLPYRLLDTQNPRLPQLLVDSPLAQCRLSDVRPIQAVHAVTPDDPFLPLPHFHLILSIARLLQYRRTGVKPAHPLETRLKLIGEDRDPVESHPFAFGVEVKVEIVRLGGYVGVGLRGRSDVALERILDGEFVTFVVDKIDQVDFVVVSDECLEVQLKRRYLMYQSGPYVSGSGAILTVSGISITCRSGLYRRLFTSAQNIGTDPLICT